MASVADCLRQHAPAYLAKFGAATSRRPPQGARRDHALPNRRPGRTSSTMRRLRPRPLGGSLLRQPALSRPAVKRRPTPGSRSSRHSLMPVHHFLVTFTVPTELRSVLRGSQRDGYRALFDAGAESIRDVGSATKSLSGCQLGLLRRTAHLGPRPDGLSSARSLRRSRRRSEGR